MMYFYMKLRIYIYIMYVYHFYERFDYNEKDSFRTMLPRKRENLPKLKNVQNWPENIINGIYI